jgi:16S rRNA processing protein RimM
LTKSKSSAKRSPARAQPLPKYLAAGRVVRPHGVRGDVLVEASPDLAGNLEAGAIVYLGPTHRRTTIETFRPHQGRYLVRFEGSLDRPSAEALRGLTVSILAENAAPLADGAFYYWQIVGLKVFAEDEAYLGNVTRVLETGANDVYVVSREDSSELLLPAISSVVLAVDLDSGRMSVRLIPGLVESQS